MLIQMHLNPTDARAAKAYRLQVKERLYRFNHVSAVATRSWVFAANWPVCFCLGRKFSLSSRKRNA